MRIFAILFFTGLLVACNQTTLKTNSSSPDVIEVVVETQSTSKEQALEFLLSASVNDFMTHIPPDPLKFRHVLLGQIENSDNSLMYLICGEFLAEEGAGTFVWVDFATIKTDGYEQWLGKQAKGLCQQSEIVWDKAGDLSALLMKGVENHRN